MSFLSSIFASSEIQENWNELTSIDQLDELIKESHSRPVVIFKHSVSCGTSAFAKSRLENLKVTDDFTFSYLDLLAHRDVSNKVAEVFKVIHQSPQILIIKNGVSVFDTSHHAISTEVIDANIS